MKTSKLVVALVLFFGILTGCTSDDTSVPNPKQKEQNDSLEEMLGELIKISESVNCVNADDWTFTPIGSKACGGPTGFLAYSTTIDTYDFLQKVTTYATAMNAYNIKWNIVSDCSVPATPVDVACVDGKAELVY
ncbi:hypothetical protein J8281_05060 [Aquimarina sp. U1-2]|uniref:hypothetical protein n=1 Tax=Aquimarina sp. U1-2 TaxID=2823141 RepID=UPI001AECE8CD|nr:hypothetical protein [Aquimarina sp. U1-2]MBP2831551.1 hypothetical protein [Aquimarina sp. U1-2]